MCCCCGSGGDDDEEEEDDKKQKNKKVPTSTYFFEVLSEILFTIPVVDAEYTSLVPDIVFMSV